MLSEEIKHFYVSVSLRDDIYPPQNMCGTVGIAFIKATYDADI